MENPAIICGSKSKLINLSHVNNPKETFAASIASACYFYLLPQA